MAWRWVPIGAAVVGVPLGGFWLVALVAQWAVTGRWWLPLGLGEVIGVVSWVGVGLTFTIVHAIGHKQEAARNLRRRDHPQDRQTTQAPSAGSSDRGGFDSEA